MGLPHLDQDRAIGVRLDTVFYTDRTQSVGLAMSVSHDFSIQYREIEEQAPPTKAGAAIRMIEQPG
jgi:hypothetical protein